MCYIASIQNDATLIIILLIWLSFAIWIPFHSLFFQLLTY